MRPLQQIISDLSNDILDVLRYYLFACATMLIATLGIEIMHVSPWWIAIPVGFVVAMASTATITLFGLTLLNISLVWRGIRNG